MGTRSSVPHPEYPSARLVHPRSGTHGQTSLPKSWCRRVCGPLADADDASVQRKVSDPHRFIVGTCHRPLASPVRPNLSFAMQSGTTIRPINILAHEREQSIAITSVVGRVSRQQQFSVRQMKPPFSNRAKPSMKRSGFMPKLARR
jgi:hypothetical protein